MMSKNRSAGKPFNLGQLATDATLRRVLLDDGSQPDGWDSVEIDLATGAMITIRVFRDNLLKASAIRLAALRQARLLLHFSCDNLRGREAQAAWLLEVGRAINVGRCGTEGA